MNLDTEENPVKVVLDTNILVSAIIFGGKPDEILHLVLDERIVGVTSPVLLSELKEVFSKKFPLKEEDFKLAFKSIEEIFQIVQSEKTISVLSDKDDNRVLEAAIEGDCSAIITGDKELLDLGIFEGIEILKPEQFKFRLTH